MEVAAVHQCTRDSEFSSWVEESDAVTGWRETPRQIYYDRSPNLYKISWITWYRQCINTYTCRYTYEPFSQSQNDNPESELPVGSVSTCSAYNSMLTVAAVRGGLRAGVGGAGRGRLPGGRAARREAGPGEQQHVITLYFTVSCQRRSANISQCPDKDFFTYEYIKTLHNANKLT